MNEVKKIIKFWLKLDRYLPPTVLAGKDVPFW